MSDADIRAYLELAREFNLQYIEVAGFKAAFRSPTLPEMPGVTPDTDPECPCGHPPEEHGEAGCLRGCDPAKCEAKP